MNDDKVCPMCGGAASHNLQRCLACGERLLPEPGSRGPLFCSRTQWSVAVAIVVMLALLSWLTILPGTPQVYAPFNLLVILPLLLTSELFGMQGAVFIAITVIPILFCMWSFP